ncbi:hypothetical protein [Vibrio hangzhouensis]|uniref:Uncharacterized protein n=1 Tax=Vibrio hangzhouensis TaxID=462991 RepID=A0A1H5W6A8_9VIBR|nr:hypothetical protein [Vibrio hangzhouensis]SEF94337.1 hypothetical protein SAMN04488244_105129 [Vibrio hangzhouensis]
MLSQLNSRLAFVAESMAELENQLGKYLRSEHTSCRVSEHQVYIEYQHDLTFESASAQAEILLRLLNIPCDNDDAKNLVADISGKDGITRLHLDLSYDDKNDLLTKYICSQLLTSFKTVESIEDTKVN